MTHFGKKSDFEAKEVKRISNLVLLAGSMYPFWGLTFAYLQKAHGYPWHNIGATSVLMATWTWSKWKKLNLFGWRNVMFFLATVALTHATYVVIDFGYSTLALAGYYIAVSVSFSILPILSMYAPFSGIGLISMIVLAYCAPEGFPIIEIPIAAGTLMSVGVYTVYLRAKNQTEAERSETLGRELLHSMREGMIVQNASGRIVAYNQSALYILGLTEEEIVGKAHGESRLAWVHDDGSDLPATDHPAMLALRTHKAQTSVSMGIQLANGEKRWILLNAIPMEAAGDDPETDGAVFCTFSDMTETRSQSILLEQQRVSLAKASRLTSLAEMASGVAHEINNPLMIILSWAGKLDRLLKEGALSAEEGIKGISKIKTMAERVAKIVSNMKSLSWDSSSEELTEFKLQDVMSSVMDLNQERLGKNGIQLEIQVPEGIEMLGRPVQLSQVLANLVTNSGHAVEELSEKWVRVTASVIAQTRVEIRVTDSGNGIPPEIREKIMQPFFTTKENGKGTGLGLSISNELMGKSGGRLWLDEKCRNTCFVIELPLRAREDQSASVSKAA